MVAGAGQGRFDERGMVVGLSGGVDSSVAAMLLRDRGYRVVGVTLKLWTDSEIADERTCCSPIAVERAKAVAHHLGIPHLAVDAVEIFRREVVEYFVSEYAGGRTPNPCAKCNARVRFGLLLNIAHRLGLARVATGHYARLIGEPPSLARGVDRSKDQSYVLAEVAPELLRQCIFPLGELTKVQVRALADHAGLKGHLSPESQEICFVPNDDYRSFLRRRLGERPGTIVDDAGQRLGGHSGTYNFTIGQRKGLGITAAEPLYVVALDGESAEVIVGKAIKGAVGSVRLADLTKHQTASGEETSAQLRSSGGSVPAHLADERTIVLETPATGVAPGQTAVLYAGERVVLAGTIVSTEGSSAEAPVV